MRPISLTIDGFTSFKKETQISFQNMEVFAITGENGAGKSSILEAMLFALYGKTARLGNEKKDLISLGRDRLAVSLEFEAGDKTFRVTRSFKTKGNPFIKLETLHKDSWKEVSHGRGVEKEVEKILRMPYEAFTKAVLIPQGNFDAFLKPNTPKERRAVLMELFDLHIYEKMRERAQRIRSETEGRKDEIENQLTNQFQNATEKELKNAEKEQKAIEEKSASLQEQRVRAKADHSHKKTVMELVHSHNEAKSEMESLVKRLRDSSTQRKSAEEDHSRLAEALADVPNLENRKGELSRAAERLQELLQKQQLLKDCETSLREAKSTSREIGQSLKELEKQRKDLNLEWEQVEKQAKDTGYDQDFFDDLFSVYNDARELAALRKSIREMNEAIQKRSVQISDDEQNLEILDKALSELISVASDEKKKLDLAEKELESLLLKRRLLPGDPCPVCGAILKTTPKISEDRISEARATFQIVQAEYEKLQKAQTEKLQEKANLEAGLKQAEKRLSQDTSESAEKGQRLVEGESGLKERWKISAGTNPEDYVTEQYEAQMKRRNNFRKFQSKSQEIEQALHQKDKDILQLQSDWKVKEAERRTLEDRQTTFLEEINQLQQNMESHLKGKKNLNAVLKSIHADRENIENKIRQIREEARTAEMNLIKLQQAESTLQDQVNTQKKLYEELLQRFEKLSAKEKKYSQNDLQALENRIETVQSDLQSNERALGAIQIQIQNIRGNIKKAEQLQKEAKQLNEKAVLYKTLAQQLGSKALQEFVVATILAKLIEVANNYLQDLTQGRYGLDQQEDNIVVRDSWSGDEPRITQTLSGGESFVVSLSLAMALTEFVGGTHLGSLFLDEGFGNLDRDKLDLVYEALGKVTGSGKLIAVVTHVEELANRFPVRLHVSNEPSGSEVRLIYPEAAFG